jgi:Trk K+ transport system NAD-binding subunit
VAVEGNSGLRPGAFVRVDIVTDTHTDALVITRSALVAEGRRWHLYRLADDDLVEQIEVILGFENGNRVEIDHLADPEITIAAGDEVVVVGAPALSDGAKVRVMIDAESTEDDEAAG